MVDAEVRAAADAAMTRCDALGALSEEPDRLTRRYATPALREALKRVASWMEMADMETRRDAAGNLIGRYEGARPTGPTLLLGSHLDTVRDAGKYDGPLGVLVALACVELLSMHSQRLPFAVEIYAFADEEGLRYPTLYLGSSAAAGAFDPAWLELTDRDGIRLADAMRAFGGDPDQIADARRAQSDLLGYCEVHIEQGPVLERAGLPLGVVSSIQGQSRLTVAFEGEAGHAGTVPMVLRRDALTAACEFALAVERAGRETEGLVATVGQLAVEPGASNVIPGHATLSLDLRHAEDAVRERTRDRLWARADAIAGARGVRLDWHVVREQAATPCSPRLRTQLERALAAESYPVRALPSGAGHDAVMMANLTEIAMLFVRCAGGISHSPKEAVAAEDVAAAISVLQRFIGQLAQDNA